MMLLYVIIISDMATTIITLEDLEKFKLDLISEIQKLLSHKNPPIRKWLKSNEVRRLLLLSPGTLQNLRVNGKLPFTKIGGVIFYAQEDIQKMMDDHKVQNLISDHKFKY